MARCYLAARVYCLLLYEALLYEPSPRYVKRFRGEGFQRILSHIGQSFKQHVGKIRKPYRRKRFTARLFVYVRRPKYFRRRFARQLCAHRTDEGENDPAR